MSDTIQIILIGTGFRAICLASGLGFAYLGYRLYVKGVFEKSDEIKGHFGKASVVLKNVAPGVVFALFGLIVGLLGVIRPISIDAELRPSIRNTPKPQSPGIEPAPQVSRESGDAESHSSQAQSGSSPHRRGRAATPSITEGDD